jgi:hypothetical protein
MGSSQSTTSDTQKKIASTLLSFIISGDHDGVSRVLLKYPELLPASLDLDRGNTALHYAVLLQAHQILSFMLSFATIGSR